MKNVLFIFCLLHPVTQVLAQEKLTLEQCYSLALTNSPVAQQKALVLEAGKLAEKNQGLKWLPEVAFNTQATYQSEVTSFPVKLPGVNVEELSKDQYKGTLELVQPVFDGGVIGAQRKLQHITTAIESQKVEIDLYQLKARVNSYFFTVLLMDEYIRLMTIAEEDLNNAIKKVSVQAANGIATNSNVDVLKAELLKTDQKIIELDAAKKAAIDMLSVLTGSAIYTNTSFERPAPVVDAGESANTRPELKLFDFQRQQFQQQATLISKKLNPRFSFFANGGYGRPGLNMLRNEFQWYYLGGVKLTIPVTGYFTQKREKDVIKLQERIIDKQKENFLNNNQQQVVQQKNEIAKFRKLVAGDTAIVSLRTRIKENASVKLANGIITSTDYITELNAENQAMATQKLHEIQLLQAQYSYQLVIGK